MSMHAQPEAFAPETKTIDMPQEISSLHRLVAEYRAETERKSSDDVLRDEKLARMNQQMDEMTRRVSLNEVKALRPGLAGGEMKSYQEREYKSAFESYVRTGKDDQLQRLEAKAAMNPNVVGPDGGYLVPPDVEQSILSRMAAQSPIRAIASIQPLTGTFLRKAVSPAGAVRGWTGDANPGNTADPNFLQVIDFQTAELYCQPAATQIMLDDPAVDIESWIGNEVVRAFALAESATFINGNGVNKPKGFLTYPSVANASATWGNLGNIATGVSAGFPATNPSDILVDLVHALRAIYRQNATFVMNRRTLSIIRKYKDSQGQYLWQPPSMAGARSTLMNFPVVEVEEMPDIGANSYSIAFGDFQNGYVIVDRVGIRALRDPYSSKPYVLFYTTKRVGGGVQNFDAIKLLRFGV